MISRRGVISYAAAAGVLAASGVQAFAQGQGKGKDKDKDKDKPGKAKGRKKNHKNASAALGKDKLKKNGKHKLPKDGKLEASAEVSGGKVKAMSATHDTKGALTGRKIKSRKKFAAGDPGVILAGYQLAQDDYWYYAFWFWDDEDDWYYWYDVDWIDEGDDWEEYDDWY